MVRAAAQTMAHILSGFAPHLSPEQALGLMQQVLMQQDGLMPVLQDAVENRKMHPLWGYRLFRRSPDGKREELAGVAVPKDAREAARRGLDQLVHHANVLAMVTSPTSRALLAAYGLELEFFQGGEQPNKPKIHLA